jgi:holo-[acyl-carrier protein] synthase
MIVGVGNDILEVARLKREIDNDGAAFLNSIFTSIEIEYCQTKRYPERHFAARFAAKEAFFKAFPTSKQDGITWKDIEILNSEDGRPYINLHSSKRDISSKSGITNIHLSLSHTSEYALANVILEL